jgi:hypothetical protein
MRNAAIAPDKDHVERDVGVVHPEGDRLIALEIEQHALTLRQFLAEHQTAFALFVIAGKLDGEGMNAGLADDLEGCLSGRLRRRYGAEGAQQGAGGEQQSGDEAWRRLAPRSKAGGVCS